MGFEVERGNRGGRSSESRSFELFVATWFKDHRYGTADECAEDARLHFEGVTVDKIARIRRQHRASSNRAPASTHRPYVQEPVTDKPVPVHGSPTPEPCPACDLVPDVAGRCRCS